MISLFDMINTGETFGKSERLCSAKIISGLFENGKIFHTSLFKVVWGISPAPLSFPAQVAFSVSKRGFKLAVTRNLLKRRMRETYRKNKKLLYEKLTSENIQIVFIVIIKGTTIVHYHTLEKSMKDVINRLVTEIAKSSKTEVPNF